MTKRITMLPGASAQGGLGIGLMTTAGNPWTVADGLADELVNRRLAAYTDAQPTGLVDAFVDPNTGGFVGPDNTPLSGSVSGAGISAPYILQSAPRLNGADLGVDGPMTKVSLPVPAAYQAVHGAFNDEHAYGMPIYFSSGWRGYKYWMAAAPYPAATGGAVSTITIATPAVFTSVNMPPPGTPVTLSTTGALPTGLDTSTVYYVANTSYAETTMQLALTPGGAAIATSGTQSGQHRIWYVGGQAVATIATPGTIGCAKAPPIGTPITFSSSGALPTGLVAGSVYYVLSAGYSSTGFQVAATSTGSPLAFTGTQSGVHTFALFAPKFENPYILVANDRNGPWIEPPGMSANPISDQLTATGTDSASYYADPYLVAAPDQSKIYCIWHWFNRGGTIKNTILVSESSNGKDWSTPIAIVNSTSATFTPNSASLIATATGWTMVAIDTGVVGQPYIYSQTISATPYTGWTAPSAVYSGEWSSSVAVHPLGRKWWHQYTVPMDGGGLLSLVCDSNASGGTAWVLTSWDGGANWSVAQFSAYDAATPGGNWYRPALCVINDGGNVSLQLFSSTINWPKAPNTLTAERGPGGFQIYTARVRTDQSKDSANRAFLRDGVNRQLGTAALLPAGLLAWSSFTQADGAVTTLESGQALTTVSGTWSVVSNQLTCSAAGIITVDCGKADYSAEFKIVTAQITMVAMPGYQDASNRLRMGNVSGPMKIDRIVSGGVSYQISLPQTLVSGDTLRVAKRGPNYSIFINSRFAYSYYDTYGQSSSIFGVQASAGVVIDSLIIYTD